MVLFVAHLFVLNVLINIRVRFLPGYSPHPLHIVEVVGITVKGSLAGFLGKVHCRTFYFCLHSETTTTYQLAECLCYFHTLFNTCWTFCFYIIQFTRQIDSFKVHINSSGSGEVESAVAGWDSAINQTDLSTQHSIITHHCGHITWFYSHNIFQAWSCFDFFDVIKHARTAWRLYNFKQESKRWGIICCENDQLVQTRRTVCVCHSMRKAASLCTSLQTKVNWPSAQDTWPSWISQLLGN